MRRLMLVAFVLWPAVLYGQPRCDATHNLELSNAGPFDFVIDSTGCDSTGFRAFGGVDAFTVTASGIGFRPGIRLFGRDGTSSTAVGFTLLSSTTTADGDSTTLTAKLPYTAGFYQIEVASSAAGHYRLSWLVSTMTCSAAPGTTGFNGACGISANALLGETGCSASQITVTSLGQLLTTSVHATTFAPRVSVIDVLSGDIAASNVNPTLSGDVTVLVPLSKPGLYAIAVSAKSAQSGGALYRIDTACTTAAPARHRGVRR